MSGLVNAATYVLITNSVSRRNSSLQAKSIQGINIIYEAAAGIDQSDSTTVGNSHYHSHYQETHSLVQRVCYNLYRG